MNKTTPSIYCRLGLWLALTFIGISVRAQFAPQAGLPGSTAIYKDSSIILSWASNCSVTRGWIDIADTSLGKVSIGDESKACGKADGDVVSLGDGGYAVYFFENPIVNGAGYDFAIFENGFPNPAEPSLAYLELASVLVSNDGINYYAFPSQSLTDTNLQIHGFGDYMNASNIDNLAGKYIQQNGTPFDLDTLSMILSLDVNNIRFVKVRDVVGTLQDSLCSRDNNQAKINDPYPTPYAGGGFDLDALAILHQKFPLFTGAVDSLHAIQIFPNPCMDRLSVRSALSFRKTKVVDAQGRVCLSFNDCEQPILVRSLAPGYYELLLEDAVGNMYHQRFLKW
jgi:hypothetical protein